MANGDQDTSAHDNTTATDQPAEESTATTTDESQQPGESGQQDKPADATGNDKQEADKPAEKDESDKPDDKPADGEDDKPVEYDLKAPEGVDEEAVTQFTETAKELGLTNEQAQAVLDREASLQQSFQEQQKETWENQVEQWEQDVRNDKDMGGDKFEATMHNVKRAFEKFSTPEFTKLVNESGWGNHPELVRVFNRIGEASAEDKHIGGERSQGEKSLAERIYPSSN